MNRRIRKSLRLLSIGVVGTSACFAAAQPGTAVAECNTGRTNTTLTKYFSGWTVKGAFNRARAAIDEKDPTVSVAGGQPVAAWSMIAQISSNPLVYRYAQVGWLKNPNGARFRFLEHNNGGSFQRTTFSPYALNTDTVYEVFRNTTTGRIEYYTNGVLLTTTAAFFTPTEAEFYGETHNEASQMPGSPTAHVKFRGIRVNGVVSGAFGGDTTDGTIHGRQDLPPDAVDIWDRCRPRT
jgi:hypothetical protein